MKERGGGGGQEDKVKALPFLNTPPAGISLNPTPLTFWAANSYLSTCNPFLPTDPSPVAPPLWAGGYKGMLMRSDLSSLLGGV